MIQHNIPEDCHISQNEVERGRFFLFMIKTVESVQKFSYSKFSIPLLEPFECDLNYIYLHGHQRLRFTTADCPTALLL